MKPCSIAYHAVDTPIATAMTSAMAMSMTKAHRTSSRRAGALQRLQCREAKDRPHTSGRPALAGGAVAGTAASAASVTAAGSGGASAASGLRRDALRSSSSMVSSRSCRRRRQRRRPAVASASPAVGLVRCRGRLVGGFSNGLSMNGIGFRSMPLWAKVMNSLPGLGRQAAAGQPARRRVVVVAEPDRGSDNCR